MPLKLALILYWLTGYMDGEICAEDALHEMQAVLWHELEAD